MAPIAQQFPLDHVCVWCQGPGEPSSREDPAQPEEPILGGLAVRAKQIWQLICIGYGWPLGLVWPEAWDHLASWVGVARGLRLQQVRMTEEGS